MATDPPRIGIVLSGTAPAMTLMSGVMLAFDEHNVEFDVISTTGVGGLIGMLYLAPKGGKTARRPCGTCRTSSSRTGSIDSSP